jgi:hypothetical protein
MARRLEIADNHSDVAVLTANAINPRMIAAPVVAKLSTLTMQKVIGVVYDHGKSALGKFLALNRMPWTSSFSSSQTRCPRSTPVRR